MDEGKRISSSRTYTISTFYETKVSCIGRKFRKYYLMSKKKGHIFFCIIHNYPILSWLDYIFIPLTY